MSFDQNKISEYLNNSRFIVLATVDDGKPALRTIAAFAAEGVTPLFSTHKDTDKVRQIEVNPHVAIRFEHENQSLRSFVSITISGIARRVDDQNDRERIISLIGARNPRYLDRAERGELVQQLIYRVRPVEIKIIDFAKSPSPHGVQVIRAGDAMFSSLTDGGRQDYQEIQRKIIAPESSLKQVSRIL